MQRTCSICKKPTSEVGMLLRYQFENRTRWRGITHPVLRLCMSCRWKTGVVEYTPARLRFYNEWLKSRNQPLLTVADYHSFHKNGEPYTTNGTGI